MKLSKVTPKMEYEVVSRQKRIINHIKIKVLDKGYVILRDVAGTDLTPVNAARASFAKRSERYNKADSRLLDFLIRETHDSPFRHCNIQFEISAPMMIARQWFKYRVGSTHGPDSMESNFIPAGDDNGFDDPMFARNQASHRYISSKHEFYENVKFRGMHEDKKQGSSGTLSDTDQHLANDDLAYIQNKGLKLCEYWIERGMAPEQARLFIPAYGMYTTWYWTCSLAAAVHFLNQRLAHDAQAEITEYANAIHSLVYYYFPNILEKLPIGTPKNLIDLPPIGV